MTNFNGAVRTQVGGFRSKLYWLNIAAKNLLGKNPSVQDDRFWFESMLRPARGQKYCEISLPSLPPDDVQIRFTGRHGRANLDQAYQFYNFISQNCGLGKKKVQK